VLDFHPFLQVTMMNSNDVPSAEQDSFTATLQDRVQALEAQISKIQSSDQQAVVLFTEAPVPYFLLNSKGRIQDINAAACGLLGRTHEVLLGKRLARFLAEGSQTSFDVLLKKVLDHGLRQRGEAHLLCADGTPFDVLLDIDADKVDGVFRHFRLVMTDVTTYKQVHNTLMNASAAQEQQIQEQATRVQALNQELEQVITAFIQ